MADTRKHVMLLPTHQALGALDSSQFTLGEHSWGLQAEADLILSPQCLCLDRSLLEVKRDNETDSKYTLEPLGANLGNPGSKVPQLHGAANSTYLISQDAQCLEPSISPHSPPSLAGSRVSPFTYISSGH